MIGLKVKLENSDKIFEVLSEPYVKKPMNADKAFVLVVDLHSNKITEVCVSNIEKKISEQEYNKWNNK